MGKAKLFIRIILQMRWAQACILSNTQSSRTMVAAVILAIRRYSAMDLNSPNQNSLAKRKAVHHIRRERARADKTHSI